MKFGVLLSGNGVFDGSEIHESVLALLEIDELGHSYQCFAPNIYQYHVLNHITGGEMNQTRNVLIEAARIARGNIKDLAEVKADDFDALIIPGGFGVAKNLTHWAFEGGNGAINPEVKRIILETIIADKPIGAICMGPTAVAKAVENSNIKATLTVGTDNEPSPYNIKEIAGEINRIGSNTEMKSIREITVDSKNKIVSAPCYMMEVSISQVRNNIKMLMEEVIKLAK